MLHGVACSTTRRAIPCATPGVIQGSAQDATKETVQGTTEEAAEGATPGAAYRAAQGTTDGMPTPRPFR